MISLISGTTAASAATDQHVIAGIWNPAATKRLIVWEATISVFAAPGAGAGFLVRRSTTRGTEGAAVTSAAVNSKESPGTAPQTGYILGLAAYTGQPTITAGDLFGWVFPAVTASGIVYTFKFGVEVGAGSGLVLVNRAAIAFPTCEASFLIED